MARIALLSELRLPHHFRSTCQLQSCCRSDTRTGVQCRQCVMRDMGAVSEFAIADFELTLGVPYERRKL